MALKPRYVAIIVALIIAAAVCGCAESNPATTASDSASPTTAAASPTAVDLTLPTTIHASDAAVGGATLTPPSSPARVSARRALALSQVSPEGRLTGTVLADVTMPGESYRGKPMEGLTCWVYVFTFPTPFDPRSGGPINSSPSPTPLPTLVQHAVFILDARNGQFVRGFFAK